MSTLHTIDTIAGKIEIKDQPRLYSPAEGDAFKQAGEEMSRNNFDIWTSNANWELLDKYFQEHRNVPVTVQTIFSAVNSNLNGYRWLSGAEAGWYRLASDPQNTDRANRLAQISSTLGWGKPDRLSNSGDAFFTNLTWLLPEIGDRDITPETIAQAEGRVNAKRGTAGQGLIYVPRPRPEHYSEAAKNDNGSSFLGTEDMVKVRNAKGEVIALRSKTLQEQAAEAKPTAAPTPDLTHEEARWRSIAVDHTHFGYHSDQALLKKLFDASREAGHTWRQTAEIVSRKVAELKKSRSQGR